MKNFTNDEITGAIKAAPKIIQEKIAEPSEIASIIRTFQSKYNLHIDVLGIIAELIRNMLVGLVSPEEFLKELIATGISDADAKQIVIEINQKIFVPLRDKMKNQTTSASQSVKPTEPQKPSASPQQMPPQPKPQQIRPVMTELPRPAVALSVGGPKPIDEKFLEDHEEPHIEINPSSHEATKDTVNIPNPLPKTVPPPANLPGVIQPIQPNPSPRATEGTAKTIPPAPPIPAKPYSTDPYREPIE
jgi:hypothetical protein